MEAARRYVNAQPPAVNGKGGHNQTFKVACQLAGRFKLIREHARQLLNEYNERCRPRWTPDELKHKLDDAFKAHPESIGGAATQSFAASEPNNIPEVFARILQNGQLPSRASLRPHRYEDLQQLASLRRIGIPALLIAQMRGVLVFGTSYGQDVWGITDQSRRVLEYRRLDGGQFPQYGEFPEHKSHAVKHSAKAWPVAIEEAQDSPCIALVEGCPDFLACHELMLRERAYLKCAPVAVLSASPRIHEDALPLFRGKTIRIFPHADKNGAGLRGAGRWQSQLVAAGAAKVDIYDFSLVARDIKRPCNDLNEFLVACDESVRAQFPFLNHILPTESYVKS